jgi:hypothetical protein
VIRPTAAASVLLYLATASPGVAEDGGRTISDVPIQKEVMAPAPAHGRHFNGLTTRMSIGKRGSRHYFPGATPYPTIRLERATSK